MTALIVAGVIAIAVVAAAAWWGWRKMQRDLDDAYEAGRADERRAWQDWLRGDPPREIEAPEPAGWDESDDADQATAYFAALADDDRAPVTVPDPEPVREPEPVLTVPAVIDSEWERIQRENDRLAAGYLAELTDSFTALRKEVQNR